MASPSGLDGGLFVSDRTTVTVSLAGEIDIATVVAARAEVTAAIQAHPGATVVVDLAGVGYLDSTGLGMLVGAHKRATEAGGAIRVVNPSTMIRRVFDITDLSILFIDEDAAAVTPTE